jgi:hypothetical protein
MSILDYPKPESAAKQMEAALASRESELKGKKTHRASEELKELDRFCAPCALIDVGNPLRSYPIPDASGVHQRSRFPTEAEITGKPGGRLYTNLSTRPESGRNGTLSGSRPSPGKPSAAHFGRTRSPRGMWSELNGILDLFPRQERHCHMCAQWDLPGTGTDDNRSRTCPYMYFLSEQRPSEQRTVIS